MVVIRVLVLSNVFLANELQIDSLPQMVAGVYSDDGNAQLEATTQFRKLLSIGSTFVFPWRFFMFDK